MKKKIEGALHRYTSIRMLLVSNDALVLISNQHKTMIIIFMADIITSTIYTETVECYR